MPIQTSGTSPQAAARMALSRQPAASTKSTGERRESAEVAGVARRRIRMKLWRLQNTAGERPSCRLPGTATSPCQQEGGGGGAQSSARR